jgi:hypothetical protein
LGGKALLECSFLIPIRRDRILSDGKLHARKAWNWLERELFVFEGATRSEALYAGFYLDPDTGEQVKDRSYRYFVAIPRARVKELRRLLQRACSVFWQKSIYLSVAGHVEFVSGESDASG